MNSLKAKSFDLRKNVIDMIVEGKAGHIGGDMSVIDILISLYFKNMNVSPDNINDDGRDRFIMSKGHSVEAYYVVLAERGFFELKDAIAEFSKFGTKFIGHPNNEIPGIEMNTGSLGHGLPVATGMAIAGKMDGKDYRVYTVMGDGELAEGSIWEAAMSASHYKLDNLCAIIDKNNLQISGTTDEVMRHGNLKGRFESFGWKVLEVDGHDFEELDYAFDVARQTRDKPTLIIANTIKGFGSEVMENKANWHHKVPTQEEYNQIMKDLAKKKEDALNE